MSTDGSYFHPKLSRDFLWRSSKAQLLEHSNLPAGESWSLTFIGFSYFSLCLIIETVLDDLDSTHNQAFYGF